MVLEKVRSEILEVADLSMKYARDLNIPSAESFVIKKSLTNVEYSKGKTESRDGMVQGVGIRVADGKKVGFATCSGFAPESLKQSLENAYKIARNRPEDPRFESFVSDSIHGKEGVLDPDIPQLTSESQVEKLRVLVQECEIEDQRIVGMNLSAETEWGGYAVATTEGCMVSSMKTIHVGTAYIVAMAEGDRSTAFDFVVGRSVQDFAGVGTRAIESAFKHLGSKPLGDTLKVPTVWHPLSASYLLSTALSVGLNGGTVVEKQNPLGSKLDQQIATTALQLNDDGQIPTKASTDAVDAEGTTMHKTEIIKDGVLKSFLFDNFYGPAYGGKSTGNAHRNEPTEYESIPTIGPNKLIIVPGQKDLEQQLADCDKAIYIEGMPMGMGHSNMITGDFSVTATNAYLVENGEIVHPVKPVSIAGNFFKSLMDIEQIGSDVIDLPFPLESTTLTIQNHTITG